MTYLEQSNMAANISLFSRVAQAAAQQGELDPDGWTQTNRRIWASSPGWDTAWASALVSNPEQTAYDPGADDAVITDGMILSQVQAMRG